MVDSRKVDMDMNIWHLYHSDQDFRSGYDAATVYAPRDRGMGQSWLNGYDCAKEDMSKD